MSRKSVFISIANREFSLLRAQLRDTLAADFDVVVQPDFPQGAADTVRKLDGRIAPYDLLLHVVGDDAGSIANAHAVTDLFTCGDCTNADFLSAYPRAKRLLADCSELTYAQWELWLALQRGIDVIVYAISGHEADDFAQSDHLKNLLEARCHTAQTGRHTARHPGARGIQPLQSAATGA